MLLLASVLILILILTTVCVNIYTCAALPVSCLILSLSLCVCVCCAPCVLPACCVQLARRRYKFDNMSFYEATAHSVRDRLLERWVDTQQFYSKRDVKRMYYLSVEYLVGRSLQNAVSNLGLKSAYSEALSQLGYDMENIIDEESDPGLGNGGLGRLASCFLDSLASNDYPAWGYGIR